jgi:hypothetical protein
MSTRATPSLRRYSKFGVLIAAIGIALCVALAGSQPVRIWQPYLFAFLCCWLVTMGGMGLVAMGNLTGGRWAAATRPFYLAITGTLPLVLVLSVPMAFGLEHIYPWATPDSAVRDAFSPAKATYLSTDFFLVRAAIYFAIWLLASMLLRRASRLDLSPDSTPAMRRAGAISLVLLVPSTTFAAFDWGMSLEPRWYSSIYGAILTAGGVIAAHALAIAGVILTSGGSGSLTLPGEDKGAMSVPVVEILGDLGNLLLAFVMLWAYFSFSQFLIIWSGDLPEEIAWYVRRLHGGWGALALVLIFLQFIVPFVLLLSREGKRSSRGLMRISVLLIVAYAVNMYWTIVPAFAASDASSSLLSASALLGLGGVWFALYCWQNNRIRSSLGAPRP